MDSKGEFRTLGVRLDTELMNDRSNWDLRAEDIFFSDNSLTRPIFDKLACGIFSDKLVKLEHLEDNLDWFLLGSPLDSWVLGYILVM